MWCVILTQAADLAAAGSAGASLHLLQRIVQLHPGHPRAHFALGQVRIPARLKTHSLGLTDLGLECRAKHRSLLRM